MEFKNIEKDLEDEKVISSKEFDKTNIGGEPTLEKERKTRFLEIMKLLALLLIILNVSILIKSTLISTILISGHSMDKTLFDGEKVVLYKHINNLKYKDIIVFESPVEHNKFYVKRVIGVPNDTISMKNDVLYINNKAYKEPYVNKQLSKMMETVTPDFNLSDTTTVNKIPKGYYFVMGDNRLASRDSREFGLVSESTIKGKVILNISDILHIKKVQ